MKPYGTKTVARCIQRVRDGESMNAVARSLGIDPQTARNWCRRAGIESQHNRRWTGAEVATLADMWSRGMGTSEIAAKLGRTVKSVERYIVKHRDVAPHRRARSSA